MSNATQEQKDEFQLKLQAMTDNMTLDQADPKSLDIRDLLFLGLTIGVLFEAVVQPIICFTFSLFHINVPLLVLPDIVLIGCFSLAGIHICGKVFEQYTGIN